MRCLFDNSHAEIIRLVWSGLNDITVSRDGRADQIRKHDLLGHARYCVCVLLKNLLRSSNAVCFFVLVISSDDVGTGIVSPS